jgi:hypothetical protein
MPCTCASFYLFHLQEILQHLKDTGLASDDLEIKLLRTAHQEYIMSNIARPLPEGKMHRSSGALIVRLFFVM